MVVIWKRTPKNGKQRWLICGFQSSNFFFKKYSSCQKDAIPRFLRFVKKSDKTRTARPYAALRASRRLVWKILKECFFLATAIKRNWKKFLKFFSVHFEPNSGTRSLKHTKRVLKLEIGHPFFSRNFLELHLQNWKTLVLKASVIVQ